MKRTLVFFGRKNDIITESAINLCTSFFDIVEIILTEWNNKKCQVSTEKTDYIFSFRNLHILNDIEIGKARYAAINFHPAPPKYPGIGGYCYALYNKDKYYGVTSHFIDNGIDSGKIIFYDKFCINTNETVQSLQAKSYDHLLGLLLKVSQIIYSNIQLKPSNHRWERSAYTKMEFNRFILQSVFDTSAQAESIKEYARLMTHCPR